MEENNRKGPGIFYAVVGVATLVVAIIGATFAYFSASATTGANDDAIEGNSLDITASDLSITVDKLAFDTTINTNLAPAYIVANGMTGPTALSEANIVTMLTAKCVDATHDYTGCHVYKITATNNGTTAITHANIWLELYTTNVTDKAQWGYAVFQTSATQAEIEAGTVSSVSYPTVRTTLATDRADHDEPAGTPNSVNKTSHDTIGTGFQKLDIHNDAALGAGAGNAVTYYLMVYLNDDNTVQNDGVTNNTTNAIGGYAGTVSLDAMGGIVRASFVGA